MSAADPLPTSFTVGTAQRVAAQVCCEIAGDLAWSAPEVAKAWIEMIPYVALAALVEVCVEVRRERLARCLRLDPLDGVDRLDALRRAPEWRADLVETVVRALTLELGGGGR